MKNLRGVLGALLIVFVFQFTFISCSDDNDIIKSKNEQVKEDNFYKLIPPGQTGDNDDDDEETGY